MNTNTTIAIAAGAGLLMYLLLRRVGAKNISPVQGMVSAGTFADLISYGDTLNSSGDGKGADAIYRQAYAVAETKAEKVRALGSLIVTSEFLNDTVSADRYTAELRAIDPSNAWLSSRTMQKGIYIFPGIAGQINSYINQ